MVCGVNLELNLENDYMIRKKIAIIGSGISGLTCGYLLSPYHDIDVYEANDYLGGHTHTVDVDGLAIDTGFIVFNDRTYPYFQRLLKRLNVTYRPTEMSFSVRNDSWGLEYNGNNINSLFADRRNLLNPKFYHLIYDILRFNRLAKMVTYDNHMSLGEFLANHNFGKWFKDGYLLPMGSAIWSMGINEMLEFPLHLFVNFFNNHGLLDVNNRPQWYTIVGGSRNYIEPLIAGFKDRIFLNSPVIKVLRSQDNTTIVTSDHKVREYDEVIFACHSDQALSLIVNPSQVEKEVLAAIEYSANDVVLHTDISLLPKRKLAHASWNYLLNSKSERNATLTYNMNILQGLSTAKTYCVTLNDSERINPNKILARFSYAHPVYTNAAIRAQENWTNISGVDRLHFCGAYWANGFHEDGVKSAVAVCKKLGVSFAE